MDRRYDNTHFRKINSSTTNDQTWYIFNLESLTGLKMWDLKNAYIQIEARIVDKDGQKPIDDAQVAPVSIFQIQVKVRWGSTC